MFEPVCVWIGVDVSRTEGRRRKKGEYSFFFSPPPLSLFITHFISLTPLNSPHILRGLISKVLEVVVAGSGFITRYEVGVAVVCEEGRNVAGHGELDLINGGLPGAEPGDEE